MTTTPEQIAVTPADLEEFAARIDRVRRELESTTSDVNGEANGVRSRRVLDALDHFSRSWSDKRQQLLDELDGASGALRDAAASFCTADEQLAGAIDSKKQRE